MRTLLLFGLSMAIWVGSWLGGAELANPEIKVDVGGVVGSVDTSLADGKRLGRDPIFVPVVLHPVRQSGLATTRLGDEEILDLFEESTKLWELANIVFDYALEPVVLEEYFVDAIERTAFRELYRILETNDDRIHVYFVRELGDINGVALPPQIAYVAEISSVSRRRVAAHEIGHLFGLIHTQDDRNRLMAPGTEGILLTEEEIDLARATALKLFVD